MPDKPQNIETKLLKIQQGLKCPKGRENTFATHFHYRSNADILAAVKPFLQEFGCVIVQSDELIEIGGAVYVKATSSLLDIESDCAIKATSYARENPARKGMDPGQLTGCASSYSRKYSLNGLLAVDDTEDPDTQNNHDQQQGGNQSQQSQPQSQQRPPNQQQQQPPVDQHNAAHTPFKERAEALVLKYSVPLMGDLTQKNYIDACMQDKFYQDAFNHLTQLYEPKQG